MEMELGKETYNERSKEREGFRKGETGTFCMWGCRKSQRYIAFSEWLGLTHNLNSTIRNTFDRIVHRLVEFVFLVICSHDRQEYLVILKGRIV